MPSSANAVGLRDQMLRLYARINRGTRGNVIPTFTFNAQWWGRIDTTISRVRTASEKQQVTYDAQAQFADECTVPPQGILKDETGTIWWLRGVVAVRATRTILVGLDRIDEELSKTFVLIEGDSLLDGVHLVDPVAEPGDTP